MVMQVAGEDVTKGGGKLVTSWASGIAQVKGQLNLDRVDRQRCFGQDFCKLGGGRLVQGLGHRAVSSNGVAAVKVAPSSCAWAAWRWDRPVARRFQQATETGRSTQQLGRSKRACLVFRAYFDQTGDRRDHRQRRRRQIVQRSVTQLQVRHFSQEVADFDPLLRMALAMQIDKKAPPPVPCDTPCVSVE